MKIPSAIRSSSVLSSLDTVRARRSPVSGIESTGGHPEGISRRVFVQSGQSTGRARITYVTKDDAPSSP
jgi:hypothetical protein